MNTACLDVEDVLVEVLRAAPRRREEDDVGAAEGGHDAEEVAHDELDALLHAVHAGVVPAGGGRFNRKNLKSLFHTSHKEANEGNGDVRTGSPILLVKTSS